MIKITRKGQNVGLSFDVKIPNYDERTFTFIWECEGEVYAGLLSAEMDKQLRERVSEIRRLEYERGYRDGRGKKKKKTWFYRSFSKST